ncbi:TetR/AcrR family transcriptional regulator [Nocardia uniformis]|uniref:TetR/AcrR family transcriptional regulator n=2 Tax=Nocardia uniformis TaxID=53432 RepID=A0A849CH19_9NOCA|nr:TetR/AcrR family transcriptional regulator [Nocardia uniformis]
MAEILDAAELVITEVGYAEMTTNAVAAKAGMSPGSLYQYFRSKDEILDGLLTRFTDDRRRYWDDWLTDDRARMPLPQFVDQVIDEVTAFKGDHPAYWTLLHGSTTGDRLTTASEQLHSHIAEGFAVALARRAPDLPIERCRVVATLALAMVKAVMPLAAAAPAALASELIIELKVMLLGYLTPTFGD